VLLHDHTHSVHSPITNATVEEKARRRRFTAAYKATILQRFEACKSAAERGALLRREGLYRSHISKWQEQRDAAALAALAPRKRGRKPKENHPLQREVQKLEEHKARLERRLRQAEVILEIQRGLLAGSGTSLEAGRRVELLMQAIKDHGTELGVARLCSALGIARASYYRRQRPRSMSDAASSSMQ
jgi:transposase